MFNRFRIRLMARLTHRWPRILRLLLLVLLAYLLLLLLLLLIPGWLLLWLPTDRLIFALTPGVAHNCLGALLFKIFTPTAPDSPYFGGYAHTVAPAETVAELVWIRAQRVSLEPAMDCGAFAALDGAHGGLGLELSAEAEERAPRTELEVAMALEKAGVRVEPGGFSVPNECRARETVGIVVPYRDRFQNLITFLNYMHRFLQRQKRRYLIVVAEQANYNVSFNRAKLFNAVVRELLPRRPQIDCFVLHDVDKLPYHLLNLYGCGFQPRQLATEVGSDRFGWTAYYPGFLGAVTAMTRWQVMRTNGASNDFYGWGGEDDDLAMRCALAGYKPTNPGPVRGRFWSLEHHNDRKDVPNLYKRLSLSHVIEAMRRDGLKEVRYKRLTQEKRPLYTFMSFHV